MWRSKKIIIPLIAGITISIIVSMLNKEIVKDYITNSGRYEFSQSTTTLTER